MDLQNLSGSECLTPEAEKILIQYLKVNNLDDDFLKCVTCRISKSGNIVLEDTAGQMTVIPYKKAIAGQLKRLTPVLTKAERKEAKKEKQRKERAEFIEKLREKCSEREFLKTIYPVEGVFQQIRIIVQDDDFYELYFEPVVYPENKEVSTVQGFSQSIRYNSCEEKIIKDIKNFVFVKDYAAERKGEILKAVKTSYKKNEALVKKFSKEFARYGSLFRTILSEEEYKAFFQMVVPRAKAPDFTTKSRGNCTVLYMGAQYSYNFVKDGAALSKIAADTLWHAELIYKNRAALEKLIAKVEQSKGVWSGCEVAYDYGSKTKPILTFAISAKLNDKQSFVSEKYEVNTANISLCMKKMKEAKVTFEAESKQKLKQEEDRAKKTGLYGNMLADDIVTILKKNPDYITENIIVKILKGLKLSSSFKYDDVGMYAKYQGIDEAEIRKIFEKLNRSGYIHYQPVVGTYGVYDIVKLTTREYPTYKGKDAFFAGTARFDKYTDYDWLSYISMEHIPEDANWQQIAGVLERSSVMFGCRKQMEDFFFHAPEKVKYFIQAMARTENKAWLKKYYSALAKV